MAIHECSFSSLLTLSLPLSFPLLPLSLLQADAWVPLTAFVDALNAHRKRTVVPGGALSQDESMSRWRGISDRIMVEIGGLPHSTSNIHKPEPVGLCIDVLVDATTGIAIQLELEKGKDVAREYDEMMLKGGAIVRRLAGEFAACDAPGMRFVGGDSKFSSVDTSVKLYHAGLLYTGIVKTASKGFPKEELLKHQYSGRGDTLCYSATVDGVNLVACGWKDLKVKTLVSTAGNCLPGEESVRHYPTGHLDANGHLEKIEVRVPRPVLVQKYFEVTSAVDNHNKMRQGGLKLEKVFKTKTWWVRSFTTLLGMIEVDAFLAHRYLHNSSSISHETFTRRLVEQLLLLGSSNTTDHHLRGFDCAPHQTSPHATPQFPHPLHFIRALSTLEKDVTRPADRQHRCTQCKVKKTAYYCRTCFERGGTLVWLCSAEHANPQCLVDHTAEVEASRFVAAQRV